MQIFSASSHSWLRWVMRPWQFWFAYPVILDLWSWWLRCWRIVIMMYIICIDRSVIRFQPIVQIRYDRIQCIYSMWYFGVNKHTWQRQAGHCWSNQLQLRANQFSDTNAVLWILKFSSLNRIINFFHIWTISYFTANCISINRKYRNSTITSWAARVFKGDNRLRWQGPYRDWESSNIVS